ncbi:hypothetical protein XELAEV_18002815mg [Xenopus laevis]|nr:hypothetical protein XELAEV_18002815mg [Xenopus laevis]
MLSVFIIIPLYRNIYAIYGFLFHRNLILFAFRGALFVESRRVYVLRSPYLHIGDLVEYNNRFCCNSYYILCPYPICTRKYHYVV